MVDPATLTVKVPDPGFMENYDTGRDFTPPPQPKTLTPGGKPKYVQFVAQAPGVGKIKLRDANGSFLTTREGYLKAVIEEIALVESGHKLGQTHIGTGQYKKYVKGVPTGELRNASPAQDYLRSHGIDARPSDPEQYEALFEATADRQFLVTGDWSAYDSENQVDVAEKWEDFPDDPAVPGTKIPFIEKNGKRFWARFQIKRYVSAVPEKS